MLDTLLASLPTPTLGPDRSGQRSNLLLDAAESPPSSLPLLESPPEDMSHPPKEHHQKSPILGDPSIITSSATSKDVWPTQVSMETAFLETASVDSVTQLRDRSHSGDLVLRPKKQTFQKDHPAGTLIPFTTLMSHLSIASLNTSVQ